MKAILIDDERLALEYLTKQLAGIPEVSIEVVGSYIDPLEGKAAIAQEKPDIGFLDIHLPGISGLELAEQLLELHPQMHIVFVTAFDEYAVKAFELNAIDYVLKPFSRDRLAKTLLRIRQLSSERGSAVALSDRPLGVRLFKQLLIESASGEVFSMNWRTSRAQELFLYLIHHRGRLVRKDELARLLWPDFDLKRAYPQLYTTVYHIRKALEPYGDRFKLGSAADGYRLELNRVDLDVERWERQLRELPGLGDGTAARYASLLEAYEGDYLEDHDYWWAEGERHRLSMRWMETGLGLARWYASHGFPDKALTLYHQLSERQPQEEEIHLGLMQLYAAAGNRAAVDRQYRLLQQLLKEELGEDPGPVTKAWYAQWLAQ
ncbi:response regulator [Paenibacillus sp. 1P07SE]|uniref:response regulator n=1 Tax=Paenibacillus sp. 1P07SE TaxID=3132209 RepID=UPI0039A60192